jgi:hypothetical protein
MIRFIFTFLLCTILSIASTVGIATGNKTIDGRPLLFKNKDRTDNYPSDVNYYQGSGGEYNYVFQVNDGQNHTRARMGINSVGFGIVYSTSENLSGAGTGPSGSQFCALALKTCSTIQNFRDLLNSTNGVRNVHEHYAIIDSSGAGSMFEVDGYSWVEFQIVDSIGTMANTAKYHPSAGPPASGSTSPQREGRAEYLLTHGDSLGLDYAYFVNEIIKDYCETQSIEDSMPIGQYRTNPVLSRYKTACGSVIKGCKTGDEPLIESMMWLALHEPASTIALPFNPNVDDVFSFIRPSSTGQGMAGSSDRMRMFVYDYTNGRYDDQYADTYVLVDIRNITFPLQDSLFIMYEQNLSIWRTMTASQAEQPMANWTLDVQTWAKSEYENIYSILNLQKENDAVIYDLKLNSCYPNPFNSNTIISFSLSEPSPIRLFIHNILGKLIWEKNIKLLQAGQHQFYFNPDITNDIKLSGGIYFLTIENNKFRQSSKLIYLP